MEKESKIDHYLDALKALEFIMTQWGEYNRHWREAISNDIQIWRTQHESVQYLGHYGGMGSINDLGGGPYFNNIKSISYCLASYPDDISSVEKSLGTLGLQLNGWNCSECGYNEVYERSIKQYVSNHFVRSEVLENFKKGTLFELAKKRHDYDFSDLDLEYERIARIAEKSSISVVKEHEWSENCPKCKKKGIKIQHWVLNCSGDKFIPFILSGKDLPDDIRSVFK
ncbi:MAG: DUF6966 domain-containing protein [Promethearchaeota archaeon]